jgi:ribosomal protein L15
MDNIDLLVRTGSAKETKAGFEVDYSDYKIIGTSNSKAKVIIKATAASAGAITCVEKAGGKIILPAQDEEPKEEKKEVKAEKKVESVKTKK